MRITSIIASSLLVVAAAAHAQAQGEPPEPPAAEIDTDAKEAADKDDDTVVVTGVKEKKVCKRRKQTGSRFPVKICRTVKEDEAETDATRDVMQELQLAGGPAFDEEGIQAGPDGEPQSIPSANPF